MGLNTSSIPRDISTTWMNDAIPKNVVDPDAYRAARGFESYFARQLVKEMMGDADLIGGKGYGGEVFQDLFKNVLGDQISNSGGLGITEMIYRQVMANKGQKPFYSDDEKKSIGTSQVAELVPLKMGKYADAVDHASQTFKVEPELLFAVMQQESGGNPNAESHAGAKGLMQLIDSTAAEMGVQDSFDPVQNVHGGAKYLRMQLDQFNGDLDRALAAYNAGPGAVRKYNGIPPYAETQDYVKRVKNIYNRLKQQVSQLAGPGSTNTSDPSLEVAGRSNPSADISEG